LVKVSNLGFRPFVLVKPKQESLPTDVELGSYVFETIEQARVPV